MNEVSQIILAIAARVLSYPDGVESFETISEWIRLEAPKELQDPLKEAIQPLTDLSLEELRELYVATFDMKEQTALYLTAHELGDSRKRGAAMIKLQKMIIMAGFEREDGELADFIPMLFEFLAIAEENRHTERLTRRLAYGTQRIMDHLEEENPFTPLFKLLMSLVFVPPSKEEIANLEREREEADLEEMPYPLVYG